MARERERERQRPPDDEITSERDDKHTHKVIKYHEEIRTVKFLSLNLHCCLSSSESSVRALRGERKLSEQKYTQRVREPKNRKSVGTGCKVARAERERERSLGQRL